MNQLQGRSFAVTEQSSEEVSGRGARIAAFRAAVLWALALGAAIVSSSCATGIRIDKAIDPMSLLESGSPIYARFSGAVARDLAPAMLSPDELSSAKAFLDRTRIVALGFDPMTKGGTKETKALQAAFVGDYPYPFTALTLGAKPGWKREGEAYRNARLGLIAALPGRDLILASSGPLEPLIAAAKEPRASPLPARLSALASREILMWVPEPFALLARPLFGENLDIPALGFFFAASPVEGDRENYTATVGFIMEGSEASKLYKIALKLAWYGIAKAIFGEDAGAALGAAFKSDGDLFAASDLRVSRAAIQRALERSLGGLKAKTSP